MANASTSRNTGKRSSSQALSPRIAHKNRYSPLSNLADTIDDNIEVSDTEIEEVKQKVPPLYIYGINNYIEFLDKIKPMIVDDFNIKNQNIFLKLNLLSVGDYRTVTKYLSEINIKYHTYQLPEERNLSVIIRNIPTSIPEEDVFNALTMLNFKVISVTRLQNRFKSPIPLFAVLLDKSDKNIFSLDRLLHCIVSVENRKSDNTIPQCKNCQRFQHTKNFCYLPPRCVKCLGNHHFSKCTKDNNSPPICVNCNENHPANYRGCKTYKQLKAKNTSKVFKNVSNHFTQQRNLNGDKNSQSFVQSDTLISQNQTQHKTSQYLNNLPSYAEKTKNNHQQKNESTKEGSNNSNITNELMSSLMPLISSLISQIIKKVIENLPSLLNNINVV